MGVPTAKPAQPAVQPDFGTQGPGPLTSFGKGSISQTGPGPGGGGGDWVRRAEVDVGKGMGPAETVEPDWAACMSSGDFPVIIISPGLP